MITKRILKTLVVMAVLLCLAAVPALAETENGPLVFGGEGLNNRLGTLFKLYLDQNQPTFFTGFPNGADPAVTPNGDTVVYANDAPENGSFGPEVLYSVSLEKHVAPSQLTTLDPNYPDSNQEFPAVSPDGQTVYFQYTARDENGNTVINDVYSVPIEGGDITRVTHDNTYHFGLEITPDGENFVYRDEGVDGGAIYVKPVGGGAATRLHDCGLHVGGICDPDVSYDGTKVAFRSLIPGHFANAIYTMPLSTTEPSIPTKVPGTELNNGDGIIPYPEVAFSPDGRYIAYNESAFDFGDMATRTKIIPVGGGNPYRTIDWGNSINPSQVAWAPASSDTTAPQFDPLPDITQEATSLRNTRVSFSATAKDNVDPNPQVSCIRSSGSAFPLGTTTVTCTATDAVGNQATDSFNVTVRDTTPPEISGIPSDIFAEAAGPDGQVVFWNAPTARDLVFGPRSVSCTPASGTIFPLGETTVRCTSTDPLNNTATMTFKVTIQDTTAPTLSNVPNDISVTATSSSGRDVNYSLPTAADIVDDNVNAECSPASGTVFVVGITTVTCLAHDNAGNEATGSFVVHVVYDWSGLLQPINLDGSSIFRLGSTVPVKFALVGESAGIKDATATFHYSKVDNGIEGTVVENTSTATPTTGNLFRYDAKSGQYVYNWNTNGLTAGTYLLSIDLGDNFSREVVISLKK